MAGLKNSNEETTPVMDDENMLSKISNTCQVLTLTPSCVIASLGYLLLISAGQDSSLTDHCDDKQFKHPDSFRACLVQVCNDVCDAFDAAHRSMNRICVKSEHIAMNAKSALKVMERDTPKEMSLALDYLQDAKESCLKCVDTAASTTEELENVAKTINKLLKARTRENSITGVVTEEMEQIEESEKNLEESCDKTKKEYNYAAAACPSPWKTVLLKFVDDPGYFTDIREVESLKRAMISHIQEWSKEMCQHRKIDENKIRDALNQSVKALCVVIQHWKIFKMMFQKFYEEIGEHLKVKNERFYDGQEMLDLTSEMIIQVSRRALSVACVVQLISSAYVEVSNKYLLVGANSLQSIALLEPSRDREKVEEVWRKLEEDAKELEKKIPIIVEKKKIMQERELGGEVWVR